MIVFHLLNDFSGSPVVLKTLLEQRLGNGETIHLYTSKGGVLDQLTSYPKLLTHHIQYRFTGKAVLPRFIWAQLQIFIRSWRYLFSKETFYINTILPVGAALAGRMMGKHVIYHYHENANAKGSAYRFLAMLMQWLANEIICVSEYQRKQLRRQRGVRVEQNPVSPELLSRLHPDPEAAFERKRVLMVASPRPHKRIDAFIRLATLLPDYHFDLILNTPASSLPAINHKLSTLNSDCLECNLNIHPRQSDMAPFYNNASVVVNLTDPDQAIETCGMTILEAQAAGLPVIVPPVGGIADLVTDNHNGYRISVHDLARIAATLRSLLTDSNLYLRLSHNALRYCVATKESN